MCELQLGVEDWMRLITACSPDWYESLCDSDTHQGSSRKRVRRAVDRTIDYLDACIDMQTRLPVSRLQYLVVTDTSSYRCGVELYL